MTSKKSLRITSSNIDSIASLCNDQNLLMFDETVSSQIKPGDLDNLSSGSAVKWGFNMTDKIEPGVIGNNIEYLMLDESYKHPIDGDTIPVTTALYIHQNNSHLVPSGMSRVWLWSYSPFTSEIPGVEIRLDNSKISNILGFVGLPVFVVPCKKKVVDEPVALPPAEVSDDESSDDEQLSDYPEEDGPDDQAPLPDENDSSIDLELVIDETFISKLLNVSKKYDEYILNIVKFFRSELESIARSGSLHRKDFSIDREIDPEYEYVLESVFKYIQTSFLVIQEVELDGKKYIRLTKA